MSLLKGYKVDAEGYYLEDYIYNEGDELNSNIIITEMQTGLFKSKWNGTEWVEGATQDYIKEVTMIPEQEPTELEKQEALINNLILDNLNMQMQIDTLILGSL